MHSVCVCVTVCACVCVTMCVCVCVCLCVGEEGLNFAFHVRKKRIKKDSNGETHSALEIWPQEPGALKCF